MGWRLTVLPILFILGHGADAQAQWIFSAYLGTVHTVPADLKIEQPFLGTALIFPEVPFEGQSFQSPVYYGVRGGAHVPGTYWLYFEVEFIHAKIFAKGSEAPTGAGQYRGASVGALPFASVVQRFSVSHGLNFLLFNALARVPVGSSGHWTVTGRIGAGPMIPHGESEIDGVPREQYEIGGLGTQLSAGLERNVWKDLSAFGEYKFTRADTSISVNEGTAHFTVHSHHVAFGLGVKF